MYVTELIWSWFLFEPIDQLFYGKIKIDEFQNF